MSFSLKLITVIFTISILVACGGKPIQQTETSDPKNTPLPQTVDSGSSNGSSDNSVSSSDGDTSYGSSSSNEVSESSDSSVQASGAVPGSYEDFKASNQDRIFFETDKYFIDNDAAKILRQQARWLRKHPEKHILLEGNCDERGTREYNYALGNRRAFSVRDFLVSQGIPAYRIKTISYGKERPEFLGSNEAAWSQNRRTVTVVLD